MSNLTQDDLKKVYELNSVCTSVPCFEFEGQLFKGSKLNLITEYVKQNPSKSFWVWLIDKKLALHQSN